MSVSITWVGLFVGVLTIRALLFGVSIRAPDFWKLPYSLNQEPLSSLSLFLKSGVLEAVGGLGTPWHDCASLCSSFLASSELLDIP